MGLNYAQKSANFCDKCIDGSIVRHRTWLTATVVAAAATMTRANTLSSIIRLFDTMQSTTTLVNDVHLEPISNRLKSRLQSSVTRWPNRYRTACWSNYMRIAGGQRPLPVLKETASSRLNCCIAKGQLQVTLKMVFKSITESSRQTERGLSKSFECC